MKPFAVDDFASFKYLSKPEFSPEGDKLLFVLTEADKQNNCYNSNIWMRRAGKYIQLTSGNKERNFTFLNNESIIFAADRDSGEKKTVKTDFYRLSLSGGEAVKYMTLPISASEIVPINEDDFLIIGDIVPGFEELYKGDKALAKKYADYVKENEDYEEIETVPWWWNGSTYTKGVYSGLFRYSRKSSKLTLLTKLNFTAQGLKLSPDKKYALFFGSENKKITPDFRNSIYKLDLADNSVTEVMRAEENFFAESFAFGDSFILLLCSDYSYGMNTDCDFYKMNPETFEITKYADYKNGFSSSVGCDLRFGGGRSLKMQGDVCYFIGTENDSAYLFKLEDGIISKVFDKEGSADSFDIHSGKLAMVGLYDMRGQELYDEKLKRISSFNDKAVRGKYIAKPEKFIFDRDGHEVHGFVLKPMGFESGKKYPVILDIHGGPKTVYGPVFFHEMQYWAGKGYFVIFCNPTGSDGRGLFSDIRGKYGTVDFDDIMTFCDEALARYPEMDADNMFETGGSYGGFMTNWIVGHTNRFKACASQRSISNWFSFYGISDIGVGFSKDQNAADPWTNPDKLWWHSPLKYADKCTTPTLFLHSFEDYRCPVAEAYQMYTALMDHGVDSKLVLFRGENHELSRSGKISHRIKRLNEITGWFEKYKG